MKWQSRFLVHNTLLGLAYSWREKIALKSLNSILCVCLVYEYLHVGCAMHNKECHMDFSSFYPDTKLASPRNCRPSWGGHYQSIFVGDGIGCMLGVWCRVGNAMPKLRYHAAFLAFFFWVWCIWKIINLFVLVQIGHMELEKQHMRAHTLPKNVMNFIVCIS